jgi:putative NAD(P)-binding protein
LRAAGLRAGVLRADERFVAADLVPEARFVPLLALLFGREELLDERVLRPPLDVDLVAILSSPFENVRVAGRATRAAREAIGCRAFRHAVIQKRACCGLVAYAKPGSALMKIAVVGAGVSGLTAAHLLAPEHHVTVFEAQPYAGGHTNTVRVDTAHETHWVDDGDPRPLGIALRGLSLS